MSFSLNLAKLRKEKKESQRVSAKNLGISQALLSHYENGIREPGIDFLLKAADYYGCSVDFLIGRTLDRSGVSFSSEGYSAQKTSPEKKSIASIKKPLFNSIAFISEMLKDSEDEELINISLEFLQLSLYRVFRFICVYCDNPDEAFSVPHEAALPLFDALYKINEHDFLTICSQKQRKPMGLSYQDISKKDPVSWQSLHSIVEKVDSMIGAIWHNGLKNEPS